MPYTERYQDYKEAYVLPGTKKRRPPDNHRQGPSTFLHKSFPAKRGHKDVQGCLVDAVYFFAIQAIPVPFLLQIYYLVVPHKDSFLSHAYAQGEIAGHKDCLLSLI